MFQKHDDDGYKTPVQGVDMKTLVHGDKTLMTKFLLQKGANIPSHAHPHEQTGYLVKGKMRFIIESDVYDVSEGDSWCIPGDVEHKAEVLEDAIAIEVFSPVREEYLP